MLALGGDRVIGHLALHALALRHGGQVRSAVAHQEITSWLAGHNTLGHGVGVLFKRIAGRTIAARQVDAPTLLNNVRGLVRGELE